MPPFRLARACTCPGYKSHQPLEVSLRAVGVTAREVSELGLAPQPIKSSTLSRRWNSTAPHWVVGLVLWLSGDEKRHAMSAAAGICEEERRCEWMASASSRSQTARAVSRGDFRRLTCKDLLMASDQMTAEGHELAWFHQESVIRREVTDGGTTLEPIVQARRHPIHTQLCGSATTKSLEDWMATGYLPVMGLQHCRRFHQQSQIATSAHRSNIPHCFLRRTVAEMDLTRTLHAAQAKRGARYRPASMESGVAPATAPPSASTRGVCVNVCLNTSGDSVTRT